jgi:oligoendopeptidase F
MASAAQPLADPDLEQTAWELDPLVEGEGADGARRQLGEALELAKTFAETFTGKVGQLDAVALEGAMRRLE